MEFLGLKIALAVAVAAGIYYLYRKYRAELTAGALKADVTKVATQSADALIAEAKTIVSELEAWAANEAKSVENLVAQKTGIDQTIAASQQQIAKATDFANKVKALLG